MAAAVCESCLTNMRTLAAEVMWALRVHFIIPFYVIIASFLMPGGQVRIVLRSGFSLHIQKVLCGPAYRSRLDGLCSGYGRLYPFVSAGQCAVRRGHACRILCDLAFDFSSWAAVCNEWVEFLNVIRTLHVLTVNEHRLACYILMLDCILEDGASVPKRVGVDAYHKWCVRMRVLDDILIKWVEREHRSVYTYSVIRMVRNWWPPCNTSNFCDSTFTASIWIDKWWKREAEVWMRAEFYIHSLSVLGLVREWSGRNVKSRLRMRSPLRHFPLYTLVKQSKCEVSQHTVKS